MNEFKYNNPDERLKRMNRFMLIASSIVYAVLLFYQIILVATDSTRFFMIVNLPVMIILEIVNVILFIKNPLSQSYKTIVLAELITEFAFLLITTDASFIGTIMIGVLGTTIPYYTKKYFNTTFGIIMGVYLVGQLIRQITSISEFSVDGICQVVVTVAVMVVMFALSNICKIFSDHSLAAIDAQQKEQRAMVDSLLCISNTVKENTDSGTAMVDRLWESTLQTSESMESISDAIEEAAEHIEAQTGMTQDIQMAIEETKRRSERVVEVANNSVQNVRDNQEMMENLKQQSTKITGANAHVQDAMSRLQARTAEVVEIIEIIMDISDQTNLLALNAAIESARAGEAGRGFAVVADQIMRLSEETKKSTENISQIITALDVNAKEVIESVTLSVEATQSQTSTIVAVVESAVMLEKNVEQLREEVSVIDFNIEQLSEANDRIVDSITDLMGTTEEVSASAAATNEIGKKNLEYMESAKMAIHGIQSSADELQKFS